jgi:predicted secreted Zn-dependent protease
MKRDSRFPLRLTYHLHTCYYHLHISSALPPNEKTAWTEYQYGLRSHNQISI